MTVQTYSLLYVRTATEDATARARIRDAAVELVGRQGPGVGLRAVSERAGVSLGLIRHHYGSKDGLLRACDDWVLAWLTARKKEQTTAADPVAVMLGQGPDSPEARLVLRYLLAALQRGATSAHAFVERMVTDAEDYLAHGVEAGTVLPSTDPAGRARFLVTSSLGALALAHAGSDPGEDVDDVLARHVERTTVPALELYTQGLLADSTLLDAWVDRGDEDR